ncbi:MAG: hypothetical protein IT461_14200 [Planctomycetes bacterium]|nr:hypothetical protein [Planctomycetota bacterium]
MAHRRQLLAGVGLAAIIALVVVVMFWRLTHAELEPQFIAANHCRSASTNREKPAPSNGRMEAPFAANDSAVNRPTDQSRPEVPDKRPPKRDPKGRKSRNERRALAEMESRKRSISEHKVVGAEKAAPPNLTATGYGEPTVVSCVNAGRPRITGFIGRNPGHREIATRPVRGHVYEIRGDVLVPLAGVIVCDRELHRTITDDFGAFEFNARLSSGGEDSNPGNDSVWLAAYAPGYVPSHATFLMNASWEKYNGIDFNADRLNAPGGVEFYFVRADPEVFHVQITNPPPDPTVITIWLGERGKVDYQRALLDEECYLSIHADAQGRATFYAPPGMDEWGIGAFGPGWQRDERFVAPRTEGGERYCDITLEPCETLELSGECLDARTGMPVPNIRVTGSYAMNEVAFTNAQGHFTIHARPTKNGAEAYLKFGHPFYVGFDVPVIVPADRREFCDPQIANVSFSPRGSGGWWRASMRPLVRVNGQIVNEDRSVPRYRSLGIFGRPMSGFQTCPGYVDIAEDGTFSADFFPWGRGIVWVDGRESRIDESCWRGDEPYVLRVVAP